MIEPPKRSVTRFFVPLIDVLTLLFCGFLVMPLASTPNKEPQTPQEMRKQYEKNREEIRELKEKLASIQERQGLSLQERLAVRVLEIDGQTGELFYFGPEKRLVRDQAAAQNLIENDRRALAVNTKKELLYLVLFPRDRDSDRPTGEQRERYEMWFREVQVRFDRPGDGPEKETPR